MIRHLPNVFSITPKVSRRRAALFIILTTFIFAGAPPANAIDDELTLASALDSVKADQTIDFPALGARTFSDPAFEISATASSNLPVSFSITSGPATINGNIVTITGAGLVTVTASQDGNANYNPADQVVQSFAVAKAPQTITFASLPNRSYDAADFQVTAAASSGLAVLFAATGHCTIIDSTVHLTGAGSCTITASQLGDDNFDAAGEIRQSFFVAGSGEQLFDVRSFGAAGDGVADDSPAFQAALEAIASAGGGTLVVPEGRYALISPVSKDFSGQATSVFVRGVESAEVVDSSAGTIDLANGLDLLTEIFPRTGNANALSVSGLEKFYLSDIAFVGTPDVLTDAAITVSVVDVDDAVIRHAEFYGLRTMVHGAGIVVAERSGLTIQDTKFLGSFGHSAANTPNVQNLEWKAIDISNVVFVDYGKRPELYCKCQEATYSWINIGNAAAVTAESPRRQVSIRNVFLDEGAYNGVTSIPSFYQPAGAPIDLIYVSGLRMNVSNFGASGTYLSDAERVLITDAYYGWSHNADAAITLVGAGEAIIDQAECTAAANRLQADAGTGSLAVINSTYAELQSQAQVTREIVTENPDDDPVHYVRNRFLDVVSREPDPAAHFYWSNVILQCGDNAACILNQKDALNSYLNGTPPATVRFAGRVTDENGSPLADVTVSVGGSQVIATETDANGRYAFAGLPSSGIYTIGASRAQYTFSSETRIITTPTGDQTVDFDASLNRYAISGCLVDPAGAAITTITINLSGSQISSTTTDANGCYIFSVPALGSYTVIPTNDHRTFAPAAATFNNIDGARSADFVGTLVNYNLAGRVTDGGAPLEGVTMTLGGSSSATTTTNATGNYSFAVPALGNYTLTPASVHYTFAPQVLVFNDLGGDQIADFVNTLNRHTISGQIINAVNAGVANVTVNLSGMQTASTVTDAGGRFSFAGLAGGGNYTITPSHTDYIFLPVSYTFSDLSADQDLQISGNPPPPQLMIDPTEPASDVLAAVDAVLLTDGPFQVRQSADWLELGVRNTRVMLFASNVTLEIGEPAAVLVVNLLDANDQSFDVPAQDVRPVPNSSLKQVMFRLPDNLAPGTCHVNLIFKGQVSNTGTVSIIP